MHSGLVTESVATAIMFVSDIAVFVLKRDVKLQLTNCYRVCICFWL